LTASPDPNAIQVIKIARIAITHGDCSNTLTPARTKQRQSRCRSVLASTLLLADKRSRPTALADMTAFPRDGQQARDWC
jgi:hypothetical protein